MECAPSVLMTEMGKYGWEVTGFTQMPSGCPADVSNYVLQKTDNETTYVPSMETSSGTRRASLRTMRKTGK